MSAPRRKAVLAAALFALCAAHLDGRAFSPDRHRDLSRDAVGGYLACTAVIGTPSPVPLDTLLAFAEGARNEDATQLVTRLTNWHYYNTGGPPARAWLGIARTNLDEIFKRRVDEALAIRDRRPAECTPAALYEAAGRVAHFIQDMRVPGHVIPIHHGPLIADEGFDHYAPKDTRPVNLDCSRDLQAYAATRPDYHALRKLLDDAAMETGKAIEGPIFKNGPDGCIWQTVYWCRPKEKGEACDAGPGFGSYRFRPIPEGMTDERAAACKRTAREVTDAFDGLYREQYRLAVRDSARILLMLGNLVQGCRGP